MDSPLIGETAAVIVSLFWTLCSILFTVAGRRAGVLSLNAIRIVMAIPLLCSAHIIVFGTVLPSANSPQWFYLGLSGVIGLTLGDLGYFGSLVILGPRRGVLLISTYPVFSSIVGFLMLSEVLDVWAIAGIAVTISGVIWVILESEESGNEQVLDTKTKAHGVLLGLGGSVCQGVGLVISKYGMFNVADDPGSHLNPLSATLIRMIVAAIAMWIVVLLLRRHIEVLRTSKDRKAIGAMFGGAVFGPFLGVWLSMVAITYTYTGVAATLMSLMPVMVIPIVWMIYGQRTSWRGFVGAAVAVVGIAILFIM